MLSEVRLHLWILSPEGCLDNRVMFYETNEKNRQNVKLQVVLPRTTRRLVMQLMSFESQVLGLHNVRTPAQSLSNCPQKCDNGKTTLKKLSKFCQKMSNFIVKQQLSRDRHREN
jgi:hypothetical protein